MGDAGLGALIGRLDAADRTVRLQALQEIRARIDSGEIRAPVRGKDVNNHIHSFYSFSPYSPSLAVYRSWAAGLLTAGIMDHDSVSGAEEFAEAGGILGLATTVGVEMRASFADTPLAGRRLNNPDQDTLAYVALHGIPHTEIPAVKAFLAPIGIARGERNRAMVERINAALRLPELAIDYERDVLPLSKIDEGGSVTERHMLFAVARTLIARFGAGRALVDFLESSLHLDLADNARGFLLDGANPFYDYDLLNVLKAQMVEQFYLPATSEAPPVGEVARFADAHGIVLAYAYLGDVGQSVTGDKKAGKFEDDFLDELCALIKSLGLKAVTYMSTRNTKRQLERVRMLCEKHDLFQISGEDINQPRQQFICAAMRLPEFANLVDAAWALIGHELSATENLAHGMFSASTMRRWPSLAARIARFRDIALAHYSTQA